MNPDKIGRYVLKEKLGQGGMATVYRALDPRFKRDVAVKILPPAYLSNETFKTRFEREAQVIASLEYPGIVTVYDFGEENGVPYLVMRYMPGGSLADRISQGSLGLEEIVRIFSRLAPALDHFHAQGIVHRDLKPGNILFDQYDTAYIADFGIARLNEGTVSLTGEALIGTPAYMSPEQAQGLRDIDGRSDIYALGAILFEALTGKQPFEATTPMGVILKQITEPAPRLHVFKADLPPELELIVERSMQKDRSRRYPTASAMVAEMSAVYEKLSTGNVGIKSSQVSGLTPADSTSQPIEPPTVLDKEQPSAQRIDPKRGAPAPAQREPLKSPSVPPFVLKGEERKTPSQERLVKPSKNRTGPSPTPKPKRKLAPILIAGGVVVVGLICMVLIFSGWLVSAFFSTPTEDLANPVDTPPLSSEIIQNNDIVATDIPPKNGFSDDFSDPESGWWSYEGEEGYMDYQSESFQIRVDKPDWYLINSPGYYTQDATIEVDAYKAGGPDDNLFGIICRYQDSDNFYFLVIGSGGYFGVGKVVNGEPILIGSKDNTFSSIINQGKTNNKLRADCIGNTLSFYVNNSKLVEAQDFEFDEGEVGLFVGTFEIYGTNILFDNFLVTEYTAP